MNKVYVVGVHHQIRKMYLEEGWEITTSPYDADYVHLGGTTLIDPTFYGNAKRNPLDITNPVLDAYELNTFHSLKHEVSFVGTGRGAWILGVALFRDLGITEYSSNLVHQTFYYNNDDDGFEEGDWLVNPSVHLRFREKGKMAYSSTKPLVYPLDIWEEPIISVHLGTMDARKRHLLYTPFPELDDKESNTRQMFFKYVEEEILNG